MTEATPSDQPFIPPQADVPLEAEPVAWCPRCLDVALDGGFVQSPMSITWYTRKPRFLSLFGERGIPVTTRSANSGYIPARRCPRCALILIQGDPNR